MQKQGRGRFYIITQMVLWLLMFSEPFINEYCAAGCKSNMVLWGECFTTKFLCQAIWYHKCIFIIAKMGSKNLYKEALLQLVIPCSVWYLVYASRTSSSNTFPKLTILYNRYCMNMLYFTVALMHFTKCLTCTMPGLQYVEPSSYPLSSPSSHVSYIILSILPCLMLHHLIHPPILVCYVVLFILSC